MPAGKDMDATPTGGAVGPSPHVLDRCGLIVGTRERRERNAHCAGPRLVAGDERKVGVQRWQRHCRNFKSLLTGVARNGGQGAISEPELVLAESGHNFNQARYVIHAESALGPVSVYADEVRIKVGRLISVLVFIDVNQPISEAVYERIVRLVRARMRTFAQRARA